MVERLSPVATAEKLVELERREREARTPEEKGGLEA